MCEQRYEHADLSGYAVMRQWRLLHQPGGFYKQFSISVGVECGVHWLRDPRKRYVRAVNLQPARTPFFTNCVHPSHNYSDYYGSFLTLGCCWLCSTALGHGVVVANASTQLTCDVRVYDTIAQHAGGIGIQCHSCSEVSLLLHVHRSGGWISQGLFVCLFEE